MTEMVNRKIKLLQMAISAVTFFDLLFIRRAKVFNGELSVSKLKQH